MTEHDGGIDETRAATITANIERAFAFVADVIDDPGLVESIPGGSRLAIREAWIGNQHLRLVAYLSDDGGSWGARVTGLVGEAAVAGGGSEPAVVESSSPSARGGTIAPEMRAMAGGGAGPDEAIDDLVAQLRAGVPKAGGRRIRHPA